MKPIRIQLSRKKGFKLPSNTVVVARPSKWGNPFKVDPKGAAFGFADCCHTRAEAVEKFMAGCDKSPLTETQCALLRGKNLACWCPLGEPCHADVLLEMVNQ